MGAGFYGEIVIRITADASSVPRELNKTAAQVQAGGKAIERAGTAASYRLTRLGSAMQNIGRTMTQFVTLPVAAGFAVAAVSAYKYESAMLKVKNLTGLTAKQTTAYSKIIGEMSTEVGIGATKMAEAFYFIASSGFKADEAMKILEVSSKASASGMGEVQTVADVVTSALNAYGHENLSAARATDILMKTIQVGKAEPEALARSLGRIMPVSAKLGVSLGEVGGAIAGLTLGGLSSAEAVTALRGTMIALVAPAKMSLKEMDRLGLSYEGVTRSIREKGLLPTLEMLNRKTDGNMLSMRKIIPNVRALNGVLSLLGENYKKNVDVTKQVIDSHGKLNEAFEYTRTTTIQRLKEAWASLQWSFIQIGAAILPTIADIAEWLARLANSFAKLPSSTRNAILAIAAFTAILGPLLMVSGSVINTIGKLGMAFGSLGAKTAASGALGGGGGLAGIARIGASAAASIGPVALLTAAVVALGVGVAVAAKHQYDPTGENWKRNTAELGKFLDKLGILKTPKEVKIPVKFVEGTGTGWFAKFARMQGKVVFTADIIQAAAKVEWMKKNWSKIYVPIKLHLTTAETLVEIGKHVGEVNAKPMAAHKIKLQVALDKEHQSELNYMNIKNIFEKIPPVKIPARLDMSDEKARTFFNKLTPKQRILVKWKYDPVKADVPKWKGKVPPPKFQKIPEPDRIKAPKWNKAVAPPKMPDMAAIGLDASMALAGGIRDGIPYIAAASADASAAAVITVNRVFKRRSPSKVFLAIGRDLVESLAKGMTDSKAKVIAAAAEVAGNIVTIFDSMLQVSADVKGFKEQGLPSAKIARGWAARVSRVIKAIYAAITKELGSLDLLDKEKKDKTIPGKGTKFTAIATLAGDIGGIFSAFTDMSVETVTKSMAALVVVRRNAKAIGRNIARMARAMMSAMDDIFVSEFTGANISRVVQIGSDIANVISSFVDITEEKVTAASAGLVAVRDHIFEIGFSINVIAVAIKGCFKNSKVDETVSAAASEAVQLATDIAGIIGTFAEMTQEKLDLAMTGMTAVMMFINDGVFLHHLGVVVYNIKQAFTGAKEDPIMAAAASEAVQLATDIAGIITTFAELTATTVSKAIDGLNATLGAIPSIAPALRDLVTALGDTIGDIVVTPELAAASTAAAQLVGEITGMITSLVSMTEKTIQEGINGAANLSWKAEELGVALKSMMYWLAQALKGVEAESFSGLAKTLAVLAEISSSISGIVNSLSEMTPEKLTLAMAAGAALGQGFYDGLLTWQERIITLAQNIADGAAEILLGALNDLSAALAASGGGAGGGSTAAAGATFGGTTGSLAAMQAKSSVSSTTVNDNSRLVINLPPSLSAAEAQSIARREVAAFEARKAAARSAATRGMVRS